MALTKKIILGFIIVLIVIIMYLVLEIRNDNSFIIPSKLKGDTQMSVGVSSSNRNNKKKNKLFHVNEIAEKVSSYVGVKISSNSDKSKLHHYINDEYKFENIKDIQNVVASEIEELKNHGLDISGIVNSYVGHDKINIKPNAHTITANNQIMYTTTPKRIDLKKGKMVTGQVHKENILSLREPKLEFKYRKPDVKVVSKLNLEHQRIEIATDPLPESAQCSDEVYLLVTVISAPGSFERRNAIRNSWAYAYSDHVVFLNGKEKSFQGNRKYLENSVFKTVFVIGHSEAESDEMKKVLREAEMHKDIVLGSLKENYRNLTMKTRLAIKWAFYECKSTYFLKTDDDVFINPVQLVEWLKSQPEEQFYTGWCNFNSPVVRNKENKWYVSYEDYSDAVYPGYCLGGGYLMSEDVLGAVLRLSYGRKLFPMEDLYVGLLIQELGGVKVVDQKQHFDLVYSGRDKLCDFNSLFLAHRVLGKDLNLHMIKSRKALQEC